MDDGALEGLTGEPGRRSPACPVCGGTEFDQEQGKLDSQWGFTAHQVAMLICVRCGYVLLFDRGRSVFDFD